MSILIDEYDAKNKITILFQFLIENKKSIKDIKVTLYKLYTFEYGYLIVKLTDRIEQFLI